jgi:hypothetical protein
VCVGERDRYVPFTRNIIILGIETAAVSLVLTATAL